MEVEAPKLELALLNQVSTEELGRLLVELIRPKTYDKLSNS